MEKNKEKMRLEKEAERKPEPAALRTGVRALDCS